MTKGYWCPSNSSAGWGFGLSLSLLSSCFLLFGAARLLCRRFSMSFKTLWSWLKTSVSVCCNRIPGPDDVSFWTTHCGVCSAEVEWVFNRLGTTQYPIVPGYVCSKLCILFHYILQLFCYWKIHLKFCSSCCMFLSWCIHAAWVNLRLQKFILLSMIVGIRWLAYIILVVMMMMMSSFWTLNQDTHVNSVLQF